MASLIKVRGELMDINYNYTKAGAPNESHSLQNPEDASAELSSLYPEWKDGVFEFLPFYPSQERGNATEKIIYDYLKKFGEEEKEKMFIIHKYRHGRQGHDKTNYV